MEELGFPGIVLMENAARGIADVVLRRFPRPGGPIAVVCGPGNNGGDGLAAARHLANAGLAVRIHLVTPEETYRAGSDPGINLRIAKALGLPLREDVRLEDAPVLLDAVFGTGLSRTVRDPYRTAIRALAEAPGAVVAVDVPSGLDANTGERLGVCVPAAVTATMVAPKIGFTLADGPALVGDVEVVDIGVPPELIRRVSAG